MAKTQKAKNQIDTNTKKINKKDKSKKDKQTKRQKDKKDKMKTTRTKHKKTKKQKQTKKKLNIVMSGQFRSLGIFYDMHFYTFWPFTVTNSVKITRGMSGNIFVCCLTPAMFSADLKFMEQSVKGGEQLEASPAKWSFIAL